MELRARLDMYHRARSKSTGEVVRV